MADKLRIQWQVAGPAAQTVVRTESVAQWWEEMWLRNGQGPAWDDQELGLDLRRSRSSVSGVFCTAVSVCCQQCR